MTSTVFDIHPRIIAIIASYKPSDLTTEELEFITKAPQEILDKILRIAWQEQPSELSRNLLTSTCLSVITRRTITHAITHAITHTAGGTK